MTDILKNEILAFDPAETVKTIVDGIRGHLRHIRKRGLIIAVSGGIDSSVSAALCVLKRLEQKKTMLCYCRKLTLLQPVSIWVKPSSLTWEWNTKSKI